jgi:hypothetical protein
MMMIIIIATVIRTIKVSWSEIDQEDLNVQLFLHIADDRLRRIYIVIVES